ncbi:MAG TPA: SPOR domain-containing protein, partial [Woeseiaceae bacterium]
MHAETLRTFMRRTWMLPLAFVMSACIDSGPTEPVADQQIGRRASVTAPPGHIRIGVVQGADVLQLGGTGNYNVIDAATGNVLFTGNGDAATVSVESVPVITTFWRLQVACTSSLAFAQDWVARAIAAGYEPYTEALPSCTRLRVGRFPTREAAKAANTTLYHLNLSFSLAVPANFSTSQVTITEGVTVYQVSYNGTTIQNSGPVRVVAVDGQVTINGARYRGIGEARFNPNNGQVAGINELHMEEYLMGVVPRELGPVAFP